MEHRRHCNGIGFALMEHFPQVFGRTHPATCDHWDRERRGERFDERDIKAFARTLTINGSEQNFPRAPLDGFPCPGAGVTPGLFSPVVRVGFPAV